MNNRGCEAILRLRNRNGKADVWAPALKLEGGEVDEPIRKRLTVMTPNSDNLVSLGRPEVFRASSAGQKRNIISSLLVSSILFINSRFGVAYYSLESMPQHVLSSTGCWLARCQNSPAAHFLHQYRRTLMTMSSSSTTIPKSTASRIAQPIPAFLLPVRYSSPARSHRHLLRSLVLAPSKRSGQQLTARFSTSPVNRATSVTLNPRVDEEGNPMEIKISPRAAKVRYTLLLSRCAVWTCTGGLGWQRLSAED